MWFLSCRKWDTTANKLTIEQSCFNTMFQIRDGSRVNDPTKKASWPDRWHISIRLNITKKIGMWSWWPQMVYMTPRLKESTGMLLHIVNLLAIKTPYLWSWRTYLFKKNRKDIYSNSYQKSQNINVYSLNHRLISSWSAKWQAMTSPSKAPRWCTCCNVQKINSEKCTRTGEKEGASDRWRVSDFCSTLLFSWCPYSESGTGLRRKCCVSYCLYSLHAHISLIFFVSSAQPRKWEIHASRNKLH